jgi:hypothetical protein
MALFYVITMLNNFLVGNGSTLPIIRKNIEKKVFRIFVCKNDHKSFYAYAFFVVVCGDNGIRLKWKR